MLKGMMAVLLFAAPVFAQDPAAEAQAAAGCGANEVQFDVKTDKKQHPVGQPEAGKALVYVFERSGIGNVTTRVGIDRAWVGANRNQSYFFFQVVPGDHSLCANWQSIFKRASKQAGAITLSAESGKIYYFQTRIGMSEGVRNVELVPLDPAEGRLLIGSSSYSNFQPKKPPTADKP
jgi:hypothetical protein